MDFSEIQMNEQKILDDLRREIDESDMMEQINKLEMDTEKIEKNIRSELPYKCLLH